MSVNHKREDQCSCCSSLGLRRGNHNWFLQAYTVALDLLWRWELKDPPPAACTLVCYLKGLSDGSQKKGSTIRTSTIKDLSLGYQKSTTSEPWTSTIETQNIHHETLKIPHWNFKHRPSETRHWNLRNPLPELRTSNIKNPPWGCL